MKSTKNFNKIIPLILSLCLLFSVSAHARFNYSQDGNGSWVATTITNSKDGLGQILREIGVQPNWSNRSWVNEIRNNNPNVVDNKGNILSYGESLNIPISALRNCKGYSALIIKLSGMGNNQIDVTNEPINLKTEKTHTEPTPRVTNIPPPEPMQQEPAGMSPVAESKNRFFHLWGGLGMSRASNEDKPSSTSTSLNTDASYHLGANINLNLTPKLITELFAQADFRKFKDPVNLAVSQNKKLYLSFGFNLGYWLNSNFRVGFFAESANTPRSVLITSSTILVTNESFIKLGPSILLPFSISNPSDLTIDVRPSFILSKEVDGINYDSGFGLKTMINYYFGSSQLFMGFDFNYENQSYENADNGLIDGYLKLGYSM